MDTAHPPGSLVTSTCQWSQSANPHMDACHTNSLSSDPSTMGTCLSPAGLSCPTPAGPLTPTKPSLPQELSARPYLETTV